MFLVTILPAPTIALSPIVTGLVIIVPKPINAPFFIRTSPLSNRPVCGLIKCVSILVRDVIRTPDSMIIFQDEQYPNRYQYQQMCV